VPVARWASRPSSPTPRPIARVLPVQLADEAICIGPRLPSLVPLGARHHLGGRRHRLRRHPSGYGFLSEDDGFADAVRAHDLTFIGPPPEVLERFASKEGTRRLLAAHGLPTIPGSGLLGDDQHGLDEAERIGYPVLVKPSAGGGGKGMRMVRSPRELASVLPVCRSEARRRSATTRCTSRSGWRTRATSRSR
jgi:acetyl-CoA carboxylase biotin carboxylase subunit